MNHGTRSLAVLALLMLAAGVALADDAADPMNFQVGVKAGVNIANVSGSSVASTSSVVLAASQTTGLIGGVFVSIGEGYLAFAPELLFTAKGYQATGAIGTTALTVVDHFNYIEIPMLLKVFLITTGPFRPYLSAGPAVSFLMSAKSKTELAGATTATDVKSALRSYDYSAIANAGLAVSLGFVTLSADVRYDLGLANISRASGVETKNSVVSILAGCGW